MTFNNNMSTNNLEKTTYSIATSGNVGKALHTFTYVRDSE